MLPTSGKVQLTRVCLLLSDPFCDQCHSELALGVAHPQSSRTSDGLPSRKCEASTDAAKQHDSGDGQTHDPKVLPWFMDCENPVAGRCMQIHYVDSSRPLSSYECVQGNGPDVPPHSRMKPNPARHSLKRTTELFLPPVWGSGIYSRSGRVDGC
jgi:hypothetical protein